MLSAIIVFPGSNCDRDVQVALKQTFGKAPRMVWHAETELPAADLIVVPGGFSYGDYLRAGSMAALAPAMREVSKLAQKGVPVLGICNGFQILCESNLLPGALIRNSGLRFVCRDIYLTVENSDTVFTCGYSVGQCLRMPIAHHDGNYVAAPETLDCLSSEGRIAFKYCDDKGVVSEVANPNGSAINIAGILNERKNVLGMMPHPERLADPALGGIDGRSMFEALAGKVFS